MVFIDMTQPGMRKLLSMQVLRTRIGLDLKFQAGNANLKAAQELHGIKAVKKAEAILELSDMIDALDKEMGIVKE